MDNNLQEEIINTINSKSNQLKVGMHDGNVIMLKAVTFSQLCKMLSVDYMKEIARVREIKRQLIELIGKGKVVEIRSEPSFYFLGEEFGEKVGAKSNVRGTEGYS